MPVEILISPTLPSCDASSERIVQVVQGVETFQKSTTTAVHVAAAVQRAIRLSTVVPLTSIIASSILSRMQCNQGTGCYSFQPTPVDEMVQDVVEMVALLHSVGGILGGWTGSSTSSALRMKRNVVRGLRVLDMVVDFKTNTVSDAIEKEPQTNQMAPKSLRSPSRRLELSAIRNQWLHLLPSLPYAAAAAAAAAAASVVASVAACLFHCPIHCAHAQK